MPPVDDRVIKSIAQNRKARHDFEIISKLEAGIILQGTEVKSLREGKCNLQDSYVYFPSKENNELFLINLHIAPYDFGNRENHQPKRQRKLLVNAREAKKMRVAIQEKGYTIIPLSIYFSGKFVKIELAVVRAKKKYDKREDLKKRDTERETKRFRG